MPNILYDGDYTVAQVVGPPEFEIPFKTDPKPYAYRLPYWQFLNNFEDIPLGTDGPLGGIYVGGTPGNFKSIGGGIVEFRREFALVPDTRNEYESFVWDWHETFFTLGFPNFCLEGSPIRVASRLQFDYFQTNDPASIDCPRAFQVLQSCFLNIALGELPDPNTPTGTEVLGEDAIFKIWKPGIYERTQRFVRWINTIDFFPGG